jgi:hypothetical protein
MADEEKTRSGHKQATYQEGKTVPGAPAGDIPELATAPTNVAPPAAPQVGAGAPASGQSSTKLDPVQQALAEFQQIVNSLPVLTPPVPAVALQAPCDPGRWCLPDVGCSARTTMTTEAQAAFDDNRRSCPSDVIIE